MPRLLVRIFTAAALAASLLAPALAQGDSPGAAAELLPEQVGDFRAQGAAPAPASAVFERLRAEDFGVTSQARRRYVSNDGRALSVHLVKTSGDSGAYSLLTHVASTGYPAPAPSVRFGEAGTASVAGEARVSFFKGPTFVDIDATGGARGGDLVDFARRLADTLDAGEGGPPVLALHLPEWERVQAGAGYATTLPALQAAAGNRPALEAVSFEGGAEAATALYGPSRLVVVEFTTPQYAQESDARVTERIAQLRAEGQPAPAYRRVGNYSVFVFDAGDEAEAGALIGQVKYEKDVRWLGDNPHAFERVQEQYKATMGGVIIGALKASGLVILVCFGVGGLFGGAVFLRRRAQSARSAAYSDAGGMLRLNIEDVNAPRVQTRLVGDGEK